MALELEFIVDTEGLQLDEVLPLSDLLELEILFEETLDFEMVVVASPSGSYLSSVSTDSTLSGSGTVSDPLAINILGSPEVADTQITPLAVEATYTPTVWSYLVGLFTTVPKSVKSHIVKGWTVIENLKNRISFLENNLILSITLTETVTSLDINLPTPEYDIELEVDYTWNLDGTAMALITVNNISGNNYVSANSQVYTGFISYCARHAAKGVYRFSIINEYVFCTTNIQQIWGNVSTQTVINRQLVGYLKVQQTEINKLTFAHAVNAGSKFIIRRVRRHG